MPTPADGLTTAEATASAEEARRRLWSPEGAEALAYLRGRGIDDRAIDDARLGWTPGVTVPKADGIHFARFRGITIPWRRADGRLSLLKIRQPDGRHPRYAEVFRDRPTTYPDISPSWSGPREPVVVVEGEFEVPVLGRALLVTARVLTLGSASIRPTDELLQQLQSATALYLATDADEAGERCAVAWPRRGIRVRPPSPHKDWTDAHRAGIDLRAWWDAHVVPVIADGTYSHSVAYS